MSFFVSDSLKGRVTEDELAVNKNSYLEPNDHRLFVVIENRDKFIHEFEFLSLKREKNRIELSLEIPQTYKHIDKLFDKNLSIRVGNKQFNILDVEFSIIDFDLTKQNERSCYLLNIVIDV